MMNNLPKYNSLECVKCGLCMASSKYSRMLDTKVPGETLDAPWVLIEKGYEYILRTCNNCGYGWEEACLDAKEETKVSKQTTNPDGSIGVWSER